MTRADTTTLCASGLRDASLGGYLPLSSHPHRVSVCRFPPDICNSQPMKNPLLLGDATATMQHAPEASLESPRYSLAMSVLAGALKGGETPLDRCLAGF